MSVRLFNLLGYNEAAAVPCPFFSPIEPRQEQQWFRAPRAPLGALFRGECRAGDQPVLVDDERCNFGYSRGTCLRFPPDAPADAVRFARAGSDLLYILERDNRPLEHGLLSSTEPVNADSRILRAQAQAYLSIGPR